MREKTNTEQQQLIKQKLYNLRKLSDEDRLTKAFQLKKEIDAVNVDLAFYKVKQKIQIKNRFTRAIILITRIAAIFALPLLVFTLWSLFIQVKSTQEEMTDTWQEIQSPIGLRSYLKLPDGTDLWLNAGSTIKYCIPFTRENRQVELNGEAFFKVVENRQAPFIVNALNTQVKVLGTQFNIKAYPGDENLEVALKEGKVEFYFTNSAGKKVYTGLKPNDHVVLNRGNNTVIREKEDIDKFIAWHQNILVFNDTPMKEVASELEKWYGVKVVIADKEILKYKFTTTFENEPLFRVLELLELSSPITITYAPGKLNKNTHIADPSIVTITQNRLLMKKN